MDSEHLCCRRRARCVTAHIEETVAKQPLLQKPLDLLVEQVGNGVHVRAEQKEKSQTALRTLYKMSFFSSS